MATTSKSAVPMDKEKMPCYICNPSLRWEDYSYAINYALYPISVPSTIDELLILISKFICYRQLIMKYINTKHSERCLRATKSTDPERKRKKRKISCACESLCVCEGETTLNTQSNITEIIDGVCMNWSPWNLACIHMTGITASQCETLHRLGCAYDAISDISKLIGMSQIKNTLFGLLTFLSSSGNDDVKNRMMHMVITGPPGHGKTQLAHLLSTVLIKMNLLTSDVFVCANRANLIGAFCGHTAKNTTAMFDKARGGVIFIDEVYSLGNKMQQDPFTKECIDTINQLLSERTDTLCIIAGYEKEVRENFFAYNSGLERRFPWRFSISTHSESELVQIFCKMVLDLSWSIDIESIQQGDLTNDMCPFGGGDVSNLVTQCMLSHFKFNFLSDSPKMNKHLSRLHIEDGIKNYLALKAGELLKRVDSKNTSFLQMYT